MARGSRATDTRGCGPGDLLYTPAAWWHSTANPPAADDEESTVISVVFSHASLGRTLARTYPSLLPVSLYCITHIVASELLQLPLRLLPPHMRALGAWLGVGATATALVALALRAKSH